MTRLASVALAATLSLSLAVLGTSTLSAQDEKKPGKKSVPEKKDKGEEKKNKEEEGKKDDPKSDDDKTPQPTDEKQAKQFKRIRDDVERKFKKSKRETIYVYATSEKSMERVEPVEEAAPAQPPAKGRAGARAGAGAGAAGHWELVVANIAVKTKDREEAVEKVYKFLVEFPPPAPGSKKKKSKIDDEPPPPERSLLVVQSFPSTKEGEVQAEAYLEQLEDRFRKQKQAMDAKKMHGKKGK